MINLSSSVITKFFKNTVTEESDLLSHILKMAPEKTCPPRADVFGTLEAGQLKKIIASHRAAYVLLSAASQNWNGLLHSFIRCQNETITKHPNEWAKSGIDLFSVPDDCLSEVFQQLHEMTLGSISQAEWRMVRSSLKGVMEGNRRARDKVNGEALRRAQEACDSIIDDCTRFQFPLQSLVRASGALVECVKSHYVDDWTQQNYWPLHKDIFELLKADDDDTFKKVVIIRSTEASLLDRSALKKHSQELKKFGGRGQLAAKLAELIEEEVEKSGEADMAPLGRAIVLWPPLTCKRVS